MEKIFSRAELVDLKMRFYPVEDEEIVEYRIEELSAPRFFVIPGTTDVSTDVSS